jgi:hypothetical protein
LIFWNVTMHIMIVMTGQVPGQPRRADAPLSPAGASWSTWMPGARPGRTIFLGAASCSSSNALALVPTSVSSSSPDRLAYFDR